MLLSIWFVTFWALALAGSKLTCLALFFSTVSIYDACSFWDCFCEESPLVFDKWPARTCIERCYAGSGLLARVAYCILYAGSCPLQTWNGNWCTRHVKRWSVLWSKEAEQLAQLTITQKYNAESLILLSNWSLEPQFIWRWGYIYFNLPSPVAKIVTYSNVKKQSSGENPCSLVSNECQLLVFGTHSGRVQFIMLFSCSIIAEVCTFKGADWILHVDHDYAIEVLFSLSIWGKVNMIQWGATLFVNSYSRSYTTLICII